MGLAFVTWFTGLSFLIVFAAVAGPALADGDGPPSCPAAA